MSIMADVLRDRDSFLTLSENLGIPRVFLWGSKLLMFIVFCVVVCCCCVLCPMQHVSLEYPNLHGPFEFL